MTNKQKRDHTLVRSTLLCAALVLACACAAPQHSVRATPPGPEIVTSAGVRVQDLYVGRGPIAAAGDTVVVEYKASIEGGAQVDSTYERGMPEEIVIGKAPIRGLDEGLSGVQRDTRRRLVVPAPAAYGAQGVEGLIPPNATLVFELHVIEVRSALHPAAK